MDQLGEQGIETSAATQLLLKKLTEGQLTQLEQLFKTAPIGLCVLDRNLRYISINETLAAINGKPIEEHLGRALKDVVPDIWTMFEPILRGIIETAKPVLGMEVTCPAPGNHEEERYWLVNIYPLMDDLEKIEAISVIVQDVTERKMLESSLKKNEERYRAIVEDQTELVCRFLPDGTLTFVNDAYCRFFSKKREELIGNSFWPLIAEEGHARCRLHLASLCRENPIAEIENAVLMPDGETRWQQWTDRAIYDEEDNLIEFQSVGRDITDLKKMEISLIKEESLRVDN